MGTVAKGISDMGSFGVAPSGLVGDGVGKFEDLHKGTSSMVPRQEETSEMNLSGESPNEPTDRHDARPIH